MEEKNCLHKDRINSNNSYVTTHNNYMSFSSGRMTNFFIDLCAMHREISADSKSENGHIIMEQSHS